MRASAIATKLIPLGFQDQCEQAKIGTDVCLLLDGVGSVFKRLNEVLVTMSPRPAVAIIGDHAPPFLILSSRDQFDLKYVPGLVLVPKD